MKSFIKDPLPFILCTGVLGSIIGLLRTEAPHEFQALRVLVHSLF